MQSGLEAVTAGFPKRPHIAHGCHPDEKKTDQFQAGRHDLFPALLSFAARGNRTTMHPGALRQAKPNSVADMDRSI